MTVPARHDLEQLAEASPGPCVSLFLPTHRTGPRPNHDAIQFHNLLRDAEEGLQAQRVARLEIEALLHPARAMHDDESFWRHQADGLAVFLSADGVRHFRTPQPFDTLVVPGRRFHILPLMPLLIGQGRFHILAVSQKRVRLFEATRHAVGEVPLRGLPQDILEIVGRDWEQRTLQHHTGAPRAGGRAATAMFHGQGAGSDDARDELERFLREVNRPLGDELGDRAPLVLAGVDHVVAAFRAVSDHPQIAADAVLGNPDDATGEELHHKAWPLVHHHFTVERDRAVTRFHELAGTGRATASLTEIVPAAVDGRVEILFVSARDHQWGRFDEATRTVTQHDHRHPDDEDLANRAAAEVLVRSGTVYAGDRQMVPGDARIAAILRY